jgi:hypothetical protein
LPKRIRVFIDFMTTRIRALDLDYSVVEPNARRQSDPTPASVTGIGVAA